MPGGVWGFSALWLGSTGTADPLAGRSGARLWLLIPMVLALALPYAEGAALLRQVAEEPGWMRDPWPALARITPPVSAGLLLFTPLNLLLAAGLFRWHTARLIRLRRADFATDPPRGGR